MIFDEILCLIKLYNAISIDVRNIKHLLDALGHHLVHKSVLFHISFQGFVLELSLEGLGFQVLSPEAFLLKQRQKAFLLKEIKESFSFEEE